MLWVPIVVSATLGVAVIGLWTVLVARHAVPELVEGRPSIRFHIAAEIVAAIALLAGAALLALADGPLARLVAAAGLGAILYSTLNSPGYYADRREWPVVTMFIVLAVAAAVALAVLIIS